MPGVMPGEAEAGWWHFFGLMHRPRLAEDVAAAQREFERSFDVESERRLRVLRTALLAAESGELDENG